MLKACHFKLCYFVGLLLITGFLLAACARPSLTIIPVDIHTGTSFVDQLKAKLVAKAKEMHVPGAVIYVQSPQTGLWTTTIGTSDLASNAPISPAMHFRIGSITKTFIGTVILQLIDEGRLKLADPIGRYRPDVPNGAHITIRELLNMTSGLYNYSEDTAFGKELETHPDRVWTPQELLTISFHHAPDFAPGKSFHYTNTNFILLGLLIEQITGRHVEDVVQQRIFTRLGMNNSLLPARSSAAIPAPYAHGYMFNCTSIAPGAAPVQPCDVTSWNPSWGWTAGSLISTLHDLQIWSKALATGTLISAALQKERLTWSGTNPAMNAQYGLAIADFSGFIGHNGQIPGYQSFEGYMPGKNETIIVLTNLYAAPDGSGPADTLAQIITKALAS